MIANIEDTSQGRIQDLKLGVAQMDGEFQNTIIIIYIYIYTYIYFK